jgi:putative membrane protein
MMGRYGGFGYGTMGGGGWWVFLFGLLILVGLILLVIWAVRALSGHGKTGTGAPPSPPAGPHDEAIAIAKRRLASGEITPEQYQEIVKTLTG